LSIDLLEDGRERGGKRNADADFLTVMGFPELLERGEGLSLGALRMRGYVGFPLAVPCVSP